MTIRYVQQLETLVKLASLGTNPSIMSRFASPVSRKIVDGAKKKPPFEHRNFPGWLRQTEGRIVADRLLGIFYSLYSKNVFEKELTEYQLLDIYEIYKSLYPHDEISTNRIYYLPSSIRSQDIVPHASCVDCGKPHLTHCLDNFKTCGVCTLNRSIKNSLKDAKEAEVKFAFAR